MPTKFPTSVTTRFDAHEGLPPSEAGALLAEQLRARGFPDGWPQPSANPDAALAPGMYFGVVDGIAGPIVDVTYIGHLGPDRIRIRVPARLASYFEADLVVAVRVTTVGHITLVPAYMATAWIQGIEVPTERSRMKLLR